MSNMYILCMTAAQPRDPCSDVEITVTDARSKLSELIDAQGRNGGVIYLTRYGERVGAVVPAEVAERFEHWEDIYWSRRAAEVLDRNEPTVVLEGGNHRTRDRRRRNRCP